MSPRAAWRLEGLGFDDVYDYEGGTMDWMAFALPIEGRDAAMPRAVDVVRRDAPTCSPADRASEALRQISLGGWSAAAVVNDEGIVLGKLRRRDVEGKPEELTAEQVMENGPSTYRPDVPCEELVEAMKKGEFESVFITDPDGRWIGMLSRQDAESALEGLPTREAG
jgi:CBS domain-containing protein